MIVCVDTSILVWGIQGYASPNRSHKIEHTRELLKHLEDNGDTIILPAPAVFEYLIRVHPERHPDTLEALRKQFRIAPYDLAAAAKNAEIWYQRNGGPRTHPDLRAEGSEFTKAELRFDCQIVATAVVRQARLIYSEDSGLYKFAEGLIPVAPVPEGVRQSRLF